MIPDHKITPSPAAAVYDDEIHMNTQSGSQWDGFKVCLVSLSLSMIILLFKDSKKKKSRR